MSVVKALGAGNVVTTGEILVCVLSEWLRHWVPTGACDMRRS